VVLGLHLSVIIVAKKMKNLNQNILRAKRTSAIENVTRNLLRSYPSMSKIPTRALDKKVNPSGFIQQDIERHIQKEYPTSKLKDMLGKKMPKGVILLRSGKNLKPDINIAVPFAKGRKTSQKTISSRCQKVAQIISQTFSHYVVVVIAESGKLAQGYFNIYSNQELLK